MSSAQTTSSWARIVQNFEDVPETFKRYFEVYLNSENEFPYTVFAPPVRAFSGKINAKVISIVNDEIRIYEKDKKQVSFVKFKIRNINYIESGTVLLYLWIQIHVLIDGKMSVITIPQDHGL